MEPDRHHLSPAISAALVAVAITFSPGIQAKCDNCGTVTDVRTVQQKGEASGVGAVAGGVLGGVLGHQVGSGRGNTAATILGAGAGAYAGHEIEKSRTSKTTYRVVVKMENGKTRQFDFARETGYRIGDKVRVRNGKLTRG